MWLWPLQEPRRLKSRFIGIWKVRIYFYCIIFKLKRVFPPPFSQLTRQTTCIPSGTTKTRSKSNRNIPNHCITWTAGNFLRAWIVFDQSNSISHIRLRSITCHFLVNNLNVITYSNRFIQPHWEKTHLELNATNGEFSRNSPVFWLFNG